MARGDRTHPVPRSPQRIDLPRLARNSITQWAEIPNFTAENTPRDGESPRRDGDRDGESHLRDGDSPRKNAWDARDGDSPNSKIIHSPALAIHAAGYQPFESQSSITPNPEPADANWNLRTQNRLRTKNPPTENLRRIPRESLGDARRQAKAGARRWEIPGVFP